MSDHSAEITSSSQLAVVPAEDAPSTDTWTVRLVVMALTAVVVLVIVGQVVLTWRSATLPDEILMLGGVAVGALGSLLAKTGSVKS